MEVYSVSGGLELTLTYREWQQIGTLLSEGSEVQILLATGFKRSKMLAGLAGNERFSYFLITFQSSEFQYENEFPANTKRFLLADS